MNVHLPLIFPINANELFVLSLGIILGVGLAFFLVREPAPKHNLGILFIIGLVITCLFLILFWGGAA